MMIDKTKLHPAVRERLAALQIRMLEIGYHVIPIAGFRSVEEQNKLYAQGRTTPGKIVTNAKGGQSYHNFGLAVDVVFEDEGVPSWDEKLPWGTLGKEGKVFGFEWGGDFKRFRDRPHFQFTKGFSTKKLLDIYLTGGLKKVWEVIC